MPCFEANAVNSSNHTKELTNGHYQPYMRENFINSEHIKANDEICMRNKIPYNACCSPVSKETFYANHHHDHTQNFSETRPNKHLHCVAHSCPLGKVVCCTECKQNDKDVIKAEDISETQEGIILRPVRLQEPISEQVEVKKERLCCAKKASWTEPRICRCDPCDPENHFTEQFGCERGAAMVTEFPKEKPKKSKCNFN